jgi:hypothetical protein
LLELVFRVLAPVLDRVWSLAAGGAGRQRAT